jgi:hypothetical protein
MSDGLVRAAELGMAVDSPFARRELAVRIAVGPLRLKNWPRRVVCG